MREHFDIIVVDEFHQLLVTYVRHGVTRLSFDVGGRSPDEMAGRLEALAKTFGAVVEANGANVTVSPDTE